MKSLIQSRYPVCTNQTVRVYDLQQQQNEQESYEKIDNPYGKNMGPGHKRRVRGYKVNFDAL